MAKLPGIEDLGATPSADTTRPVADISAGGAAIAAGGKALGQGVENFGVGVGDAYLQKSRFEYATGHAQLLTNLETQSNAAQQDPNPGRDDDGKTLVERHSEAFAKIQTDAAGAISDPRMRQRFLEQTAPQVQHAINLATNHARNVQDNDDVANTSKQSVGVINTAIATSDDKTRKQLLDAQNASFDTLRDKGAASSTQVLQMKRDFAQRYAIADGLHRADTDPDGVINELRARPGTGDDVTNRIVSNEGGGANPRSSARGTGQFIDSTWLDVLKRNRPDLAQGRSDQELLALRADRGLGRQMTDAYRRENSDFLVKQGLEATPGNQYLAHFLGPAGAAAVLKANPNQPVSDVLANAVGPDKARAMVEANPTVLHGQLAGSVKQWADAKMGGVVPGGGSIYDALEPDVREKLLSYALDQRHKRNVDELAGFHQRLTDTTAEALDTGQVAKPMQLEDFVSAHGAERGPAEFRKYQDDIKLGADKSKLSGMSDVEMDKLIEGYSPKQGQQGFSDQQKRQAILFKAADDLKRARAEDPAFKQRVEDSTAEALDTGKATRPLSPDDFNFALGHKDGPAAYAKYAQNLKLGADRAKLPAMSDKEIGDLVQGYSPKPGDADYVDEGKRQSALWKAADQLRKERDEDPAGYAIKYLPAARDAWAQFQKLAGDATVSADDRAAAARDFAVKTEIEQARIGIPADKRRIVPGSYVDAFNGSLEKAATSDDPQARIGLIAKIQNEGSLWGSYFPQIMRDLAPKAQPLVRAIAAGADPVAMTRLLSVPKDETPSKVLKEQSETKAGDLAKAVNEEMAPFLRSLVGRQRDRDYGSYHGLATELGALYVRDGDDPTAAARKAFTALIGGRYDFRDTYRIPKSSGVSPDDVQAGAEAARSLVAQGGFKPNFEAADRELQFTPQERALYQRHLDNLVGPGGVDNPNGSRSTLQQRSFEVDGRYFNLPSVRDGKVLSRDDTFARAREEGLNNFPSYASEDEAEKRYDKMHGFMDKDTGAYLRQGIKAPIDDVGIGARDAFTKLGRDGKWVTSPDNSGLNLAYGDKFVRTRAGAPLLFTWAELGRLAAGRRSEDVSDRAAATAVQ